jgi:hypothetical protein
LQRYQRLKTCLRSAAEVVENMMSGVCVVLEQVKARTPAGRDLEESTPYSRDCRLVWRYFMVA